VDKHPHPAWLNQSVFGLCGSADAYAVASNTAAPTASLCIIFIILERNPACGAFSTGPALTLPLNTTSVN